jgi:nucleoid DNA-binding protein
MVYRSRWAFAGCLFELVKHFLQNGEDVLISGFGKFSAVS